MTTESVSSPVAAEEPEPAGPGHQRLRRRLVGALVGGVCAGFAEYIEVEAIVVRVVFVVVAVASGGFALVLYPLAWALIPGEPALSGRLPWRARFAGSREAIAIALFVVLAIAAARGANLWLGNQVVMPLVAAACGLALILRQAARADWVPGDALADRGIARRRSWGYWPRTVVGAILIIVAAFLVLHEAGIWGASRKAFAGILVIVSALGLVFAPWFLRLVRTLASERSERIRSQERAEVAAHLHDSVLQTLALIQRRAEDPREVAGLARSQERELRHWLFERDHRPGAETLATTLEQVATEVEMTHRVRIEVVTVGDCPLDDRLGAMAAAAREALTNAAKFAGEDQIDLYAEVGPQRAQLFVRDRGIGFDPAAIPADRCGVRQSIVERMRRHGGRAAVHSAPGSGTEVELVMERG